LYPEDIKKKYLIIVIYKGDNKTTKHQGNTKSEAKSTINHQQSDKVEDSLSECWETVMALTWYRHFKGNGGLNRILQRTKPSPSNTVKISFGSDNNSPYILLREKNR